MLPQTDKWKVEGYKAVKRPNGPYKDSWGVEVTFRLPDNSTDTVIYNIYSTGKAAKTAAKRATITGSLVFNSNEPGGPLWFYDPELHEKYNPELLTQLTNSLLEQQHAITNTTSSES